MNELPNLLNDTWRFFRTNAWGIWSIIYPLAVPLSLISTVLTLFPDSSRLVTWGVFGLIILVYPIIQGALILYISSILTDEIIPRVVCYRLALRFWLPLLALYIIIALSVTAGFILLIIPGLIVLARIMFSEFHCILNEQGPIDSFNLSWNDTKDYQWLLLTGYIVLTLCTYIPVWLLEKTVISTGPVILFFYFFINLLEYILASLITIFSYRVFTHHIESLNNK